MSQRRGLPMEAMDELLDLPLQGGGEEPAFLRGKTRARARRARRGVTGRAILLLQVAAAAFIAVAEQRVAQDQEGSRHHQERHGRQGRHAGTGAELVEARQVAGEELVAIAAHARDGETERQRQQHLHRFRRHFGPQRRALVSQSSPLPASKSLINGKRGGSQLNDQRMA